VIEAVHFAGRQYTAAMIAGAHFLLYSEDPEGDRVFFKTALEFPSAHLGDGRLVFALKHVQFETRRDFSRKLRGA
jgi:hypothetical protein